MSGVEHPRNKDRETLIATFQPKRVSSLFNYVFGAVLAAFGLIFMIGSSGGFVAFSFIAWSLGMASIWIGSIIMAFAEVMRRRKLYIITDWNVRKRVGYINKKTFRVFYDDIEDVRVESDEQDRIAGQGDVLIFTDTGEEPALVFENVQNPTGIREIILRFLKTVEKPVPWSHIEKTRVAPY